MTSITASSRPGRVPVEHRVLGLDRRTFPLAAVALGTYLLWAWVMPWIAGQVAWDDPIRAGETIQVTPTVTMTPPAGWGVVSGLRTSDRTLSGTESTDETILVNGGITLDIKTGKFTGSPTKLLRQAILITTTLSGPESFKARTGARSTTTSSGLHGVVEGYQSQRNAGVMAAFVVDGRGIQIQVVGPPSQMSQQAETIGRMLDSLTRVPPRSGS